MPTIQVHYQIRLSDFRKASYYGLFLRQRKPLLIFFCVLLVSVLYTAGAAAGFGRVNPLVFLIAGAYLVWALFLFAGTEKRILTYLRSADCLFGEELCMTLDGRGIQMEIRSRNVKFARSLNQLTAAFELNDLFLFYLSAQDVYLLPRPCISAEEQSALRRTLHMRLKDRFSSRFLPRSS